MTGQTAPAVDHIAHVSRVGTFDGDRPSPGERLITARPGLVSERLMDATAYDLGAAGIALSAASAASTFASAS